MATQLPASIGSASALPLATALAVIPSLPRPLLNRLVERAIERLDEIDGDANREEDDPPEEDSEDCAGLDGDEDEPDYNKRRRHCRNQYGPGCPINDPGGCEHDGREPDHDAEVETWAHPDDHRAELFIGKR